MNDASSQNAGSSREWSDDELIPFGKYVLLDRMSSGATAAVYRANVRGEAGFERLVAIKRILPHMAGDRGFVDTFVREAKTVAKLAHEGICPIYELGKVGESLYMAIEYIQGRDLGLIVRRVQKRGEQMPPLIAAWIAARLCDALDYAHTLKNARGSLTGMIHRDISPTNIIVSYEGQVKLVDFGLAKAVGRAESTNVDALRKKLSYMSPEMVKGKPLDARSDLFGVGVCFYEMITGRKLFVGKNEIDTLGLVGRASVLPPSAVMDDAPEDLELIIMRALQREPDDRYQSAAEMSEALYRFMQRTDPTFGPRRLSDWMHELFANDIEEEQARIKVLLAASKDAALIKTRAAFFASPSGAAARARAELERRLSSAAPPPRPKGAPPPPPKPATASAKQEGGQFDDEPTRVEDMLEEMTIARGFEDEPTRLHDGDVAEATRPDTGGFDEEPTQIFFNKEEGVGMQALLEESELEVPSGPLNRPIVAPDLRAESNPEFAVPRLPRAPAPIPARATVPHPARATVPNPPRAPVPTPRTSSVPPPAVVSAASRASLWVMPVAALALVALCVVLITTTDLGITLGLRTLPTGAIEIRTLPPAAAVVTLDGVYRGNAPLRLEGVPVGPQPLSVQAPGFLPVSRQLEIVGGSTLVLELTLTPEHPAPAARPAPVVPEAGAAQPIKTPAPTVTPSASTSATPSPTPPQPTERQPVERSAARQERRAPRDTASSAAPGTLAVSSVPWSYITIDGRDIGRTTPLLRYPIEPGRHEIRLTTSTGAKYVERIEVRPGQPVRVYHRF